MRPSQILNFEERILNGVEGFLTNLGCDRNKPLGIACSGGGDSLVLADLCHRLGFSLVLIHANFHLRGDDSNLDQACVENFGMKHGIPLISKDFFIQKENKNIQQTARSLRYEWWDDLLKEGRVQFIATGHHGQDLVETSLLYWARGGNFMNLLGIQAVRDRYIRPLLAFTKAEILELATRWQVDFREDKSNFDDDYLRNKVRHHLIPELQKINPNYISNIPNHLKIAADHNRIIQDTLAINIDCVYTKLNDRYAIIDTKKLSEFAWARSILWSIIEPLGYNTTQLDEILSSFTTKFKNIYLSHTHALMILKGEILIKKKGDFIKELPFTIQSNDLEFNYFHFTISIEKPDTKDSSLDFIAIEKTFLEQAVIRTFKPGDKMKSARLRGATIKISDVFINHKINNFYKEDWPIIECEQKIIWIPFLEHSILTKSKTISKPIYLVCKRPSYIY